MKSRFSIKQEFPSLKDKPMTGKLHNGGNDAAQEAHRARWACAAVNGAKPNCANIALYALCVAFCAILESGLNPHQIKGQKGRTEPKGISPWCRFRPSSSLLSRSSFSPLLRVSSNINLTPNGTKK